MASFFVEAYPKRGSLIWFWFSKEEDPVRPGYAELGRYIGDNIVVDAALNRRSIEAGMVWERAETQTIQPAKIR